MKKVMILSVILSIFACSPKQSPTPSGVHADGGVDVGNMTSRGVPQTSALISFPLNWSSVSSDSAITIQNQAGSSIVVEKSSILDLTSPNAVSLQQYLKSKYPDRDYEIVSINGLDGVRAELIDTSEEKSSDLYLVSEVKDFIHLQSHLKRDGDGIIEGDNIVLTIRIKYLGAAYQNSKVDTVTLKTGPNSDQSSYAFSGDCYSHDCNGGVIVLYNPQKNELQIGGSGYEYGRIAELGPDTQIPFESIRVDGSFLVAPLSNVPISDIYTAFSPKNLQADQDSMIIKAGYVYLIRTINWPDEDLITKVHVDNIADDGAATITYEKLVYVPKDQLQAQVDLINKNTLQSEMPIADGEVLLYNRSIWHNYFYASFNFRYSTSGNMFITRNSWDLSLEMGCSGKTSLFVPYSNGGLGAVTDLGLKDVGSVDLADFPDPNNFKRDCGTAIEKGHTYAVYHYDFGDDNASAVFGVVQVLDIGPNDSWIRLHFRRIKIGPADYFQKWISLPTPQGIQKIVLDKTSWLTTRFCPFTNQRGDQGSACGGIDFVSIPGLTDYISADDRPYAGSAGFFKIPSDIFDQETVADIETQKGHFVDSIEFNKDDVYAIIIENYEERTVMVMRIEDRVAGQSVTLSVKYLERDKAPYADAYN